MNLRYCILTTKLPTEQSRQNIKAVDFLQWNKVFQGDILDAKKTLSILKDDDFDIIHLAADWNNLDLIMNVRDKLGKKSKTKLVLYFGQTLTYWNYKLNNLNNLYNLKQAIDSADFVSASEYSLAGYLEELTGKRIYELPHPFDLEKLKVYSSLKKNSAITFVYQDDLINFKLLKIFFFFLGKKVRFLTFKEDRDINRIGRNKLPKVLENECLSEAEFYTAIAERMDFRTTLFSRLW